MAPRSSATDVMVHGVVRVPGDKSVSHRALLCAALADGPSRIRGILNSADVRSTAGVLRALGVEVPTLSADLTLQGRGLRGLLPHTGALDCGNSGTTARLSAGITAGYPYLSRFVGDASLSRRPMGRIARPLRAMGAQVECERGDGLPMVVRGGALRETAWQSDTASAQVKSAVLFAGLVAGVPVSVTEPARSRDHTERMFSALGVRVAVQDRTVSLLGGDAVEAQDTLVPGDPSSAAFFAALGALAPGGSLEMPAVGLNETRIGFFRALGRMGAAISVERVEESAGEPVGTVCVRGGSILRATAVGVADVPSMIDELPLLACVASRAEGTTVISGAEELRVKESDRIAAVVENLRALAVDAGETADGMWITGSDRPLRGRVTTHGDHRLAMAFAVLGAATGNAIVLDDRTCVAVSYPGFWGDLSDVTGRAA